MKRRSSVSLAAGAVVASAVIVAVARLSAQIATPPDPATGAAPWRLARTAWGDPDLQGLWSSSTRPFRTDSSRPLRPGDTGAGPEHWYESTPVANISQLTIVDPPGQQVPPLTPLGQQRAAARATERARRAYGPLDFSPWDRCITRGVPGSMVPITYNNNYHFIQTRDHVVILYEMIHDARIVPLDGRPHVSTRIRQWMGDSRGRWEGNTLVVEATNFSDQTHIAYNDGYHTDALRVVERFTRTDANTIDYRFTIDDPATWTKPWTASVPLMRIRGPIHEYACHEGNKGLPNMLSAARAEDAREQARPAREQDGLR